MDRGTDRETLAVVLVYEAKDQDKQILRLIDVIADMQWNCFQAGVVVREREARNPSADHDRTKR